MKRSLNLIVILWALLIIVVACFGNVTFAATNAGRTAADFLLIGQGARAAALGGAYTAISSGASAAYWNPAGLMSLEEGQISLGHFSWYQDISVEQLSAGMPISDDMAAAISITYIDYGKIEGYDMTGASTGQIAAYDWSGGLSLGYALNESIALGITAKYVNQRLDDVSASAFAADFGIKYSSSSFNLAAAVSNMGGDLKFDQVSEKLPALARVGVSVMPIAGALETSFEIEKRFQGDIMVRQGVELGFSDQYFLRAGYDYLPAQNGRALATGISLGAGLRFNAAELDYAFTPDDKATSENLHRFTLSFRFAN